jgi:hypothetical protein
MLWFKVMLFRGNGLATQTEDLAWSLTAGLADIGGAWRMWLTLGQPPVRATVGLGHPSHHAAVSTAMSASGHFSWGLQVRCDFRIWHQAETRGTATNTATLSRTKDVMARSFPRPPLTRHSASSERVCFHERPKSCT